MKTLAVVPALVLLAAISFTLAILTGARGWQRVSRLAIATGAAEVAMIVILLAFGSLE